MTRGKVYLFWALIGLLGPIVNAAEMGTPVHVTVYKEEGRFLGWPANGGLAWRWGDEILVSFLNGVHKDTPKGHAIDKRKPHEEWFARSLNGGLTWNAEHPVAPNSVDPYENPGDGRAPTDPVGGINFTDPNFVMLNHVTMTTPRAFDPNTNRPGARAYFQYSYDRGKTWSPRYWLPNFGFEGVWARTDYLVKSSSECQVFLTVKNPDDNALGMGRCIAVRTTDGGKTWTLDGLIGPAPVGTSRIMSSTVRLSPTTLISALRTTSPETGSINVYRSENDGKTWTFLSEPVAWGAQAKTTPPSLLQLQDGRVALIYGDRREPYRMCATLSSDGGKSWGPELTLRSGAGNFDFSYPRSVQRADGKIVTVYYWNEGPDPATNLRYIAATIWAPPPRS